MSVLASICSRLKLSSCTCTLLSRIKLVSVRGKDMRPFIQSLITNDINLLVGADNQQNSSQNVASWQCCSSLYTMFLSISGRVLFDTIIHQHEAEDRLLLECDIDEVDALINHLKKYKMRKKVEFNCDERLNLFAVLNKSKGSLNDVKSPEVNDKSSKCAANLIANPDARVPNKSSIFRIISLNEESCKDVPQTATFNDYVQRRYELGIPEGPLEILREKALPLNYNVDLMNGVSFSKGCYLGQELTARTHHTGVIRRRVFPIELSKPIPPDSGSGPSSSNLPIHNPLDGMKMGNLISTLGNRGLAMLKVDHGETQLKTLSDTTVFPQRPFWS